MKIVLQVKMFRMAFSFTGMNLYRTKTLEQLFALFFFLHATHAVLQTSVIHTVYVLLSMMEHDESDKVYGP